eukprot:714962-Alexandrium_andersonii.AAC.1
MFVPGAVEHHCRVSCSGSVLAQRAVHVGDDGVLDDRFSVVRGECSEAVVEGHPGPIQCSGHCVGVGSAGVSPNASTSLRGALRETGAGCSTGRVGDCTGQISEGVFLRSISSLETSSSANPVRKQFGVHEGVDGCLLYTSDAADDM